MLSEYEKKKRRERSRKKMRNNFLKLLAISGLIIGMPVMVDYYDRYDESDQKWKQRQREDEEKAEREKKQKEREKKEKEVERQKVIEQIKADIKQSTAEEGRFEGNIKIIIESFYDDMRKGTYYMGTRIGYLIMKGVKNEVILTKDKTLEIRDVDGYSYFNLDESGKLKDKLPIETRDTDILMKLQKSKYYILVHQLKKLFNDNVKEILKFCDSKKNTLSETSWGKSVTINEKDSILTTKELVRKYIDNMDNKSFGKRRSRRKSRKSRKSRKPRKHRSRR